MASFGKTPPHRSMLDKVSPDNPVVLADISGHSAVGEFEGAASSRASRRQPRIPPAGSSSATAKAFPPDCCARRLGGLVRRLIPAYTAEQNIKGLTWSLSLMLSHGITSYTDAGVDEDAMQAYATLADRGVLKQRVRGCIMWRSLMFTRRQQGRQRRDRTAQSLRT